VNFRVMLLLGLAIPMGCFIFFDIFNQSMVALERVLFRTGGGWSHWRAQRAEARRVALVHSLRWPANLADGEFDRFCREYLQMQGWDVLPMLGTSFAEQSASDPAFYILARRDGQTVTLRCVPTSAGLAPSRVIRFGKFARGQGADAAVMVCQFAPRADSLEATSANGVSLIQIAALHGFDHGVGMPAEWRMPPARPAMSNGPHLVQGMPAGFSPGAANDPGRGARGNSELPS